MHTALRAALGLVSLTGASAYIDPANAKNITVYHVNEPTYSGIANMDTGDAAGDAFFALKAVFVPIECSSNNTHHFSGDCDNPEVVGPKLSVTEVVVEVDSNYGNYSECNVCVNNTVPLTRDVPCTNGDYVCVCGADFRNLTTDCPPTVGQEFPSSIFGRFKPGIFSPNYQWWLHNLVNRLGNGSWFSTPAAGECKQGREDAACYWRVVETKKQIDKKCQDDYINQQVTKLNPSCFDACPQPTNSSSTCFIECFYSTTLGPNSAHAESTGGLTGDQIVDMWVFPLQNGPNKGGCPPL